jgi:hypothetical protein
MWLRGKSVFCEYIPGRDAQIGRLHKSTNADNTENQPTIPGRDAQFGRLYKFTNADNTENPSTIPGRDAQILRLYKSLWVKPVTVI